jgi:hypothetical protein
MLVKIANIWTVNSLYPVLDSGNFAEHQVGENMFARITTVCIQFEAIGVDVIYSIQQYLRALAPFVLEWEGGCYAQQRAKVDSWCKVI